MLRPLYSWVTASLSVQAGGLFAVQALLLGVHQAFVFPPVFVCFHFL